MIIIWYHPLDPYPIDLICNSYTNGKLQTTVIITNANVIIIIGHHCPSLKYLNRHVKKPVGRKWYDLGIDLLEADDVVQLDRIQSEHSADFNTCCTKMFQLWLSKQPTASWNQLLDSLRQPGIELDHIAFKIKKMLLQSNPTGKELLLVVVTKIMFIYVCIYVCM